MRIGIVADVHCNDQALRIALERMGAVDELICAGDAVYQFRFSNDVMDLLRERETRYVLGNHEDVLLGKWGGHARSSAREDALVIGTIERSGDTFKVKAWLYNVKMQKSVFGKEYSGSIKNERIFAHTMSDEIHLQQRALAGVARACFAESPRWVPTRPTSGSEEN